MISPDLPSQLKAVGVKLVDNRRGDHALKKPLLGFKPPALGQVLEHDGDALGSPLGALEWTET